MPQDADNVSYNRLPVEDASAFLLARSGTEGTEGEQETARALAEALGGFALVLELAAAHCAGEKMPLREYLGLWRDADAPDPLDFGACVRRAVELSLDALAREWGNAANLFGLCAFLAPADIPYEMIFQGAFAIANPETGEALEAAHAERRFKTIRSTLRDYGLIVENDATWTFSLAPDVQAATRELMEPEIRRGLLERAVELGANAFPEISEANSLALRRLLPHALFLAEWIDAAGVASPSARFLLHQTANYLLIQQEYDAARTLYERALAILQATEAHAHPDALACLYSLATLYRDQGDLAAAEPILLRALYLLETVKGNRHPDLVPALNHLAQVYHAQGRTADAARSLRRAVRILEKQFGKEDPAAAAMRDVLNALGDETPRPRIIAHDAEEWIAGD